MFPGMTEEQPRRLSAVMFTDVVGYTALMQDDEVPSFGFWDPIRSDERFTELMDKMGLAAKARLPTRVLLLS